MTAWPSWTQSGDAITRTRKFLWVSNQKRTLPRLWSVAEDSLWISNDS
jgi:hypothetical protein